MKLQFFGLLERTGMAEVKEIINPISIDSNRRSWSFLGFPNLALFLFFHHTLFCVCVFEIERERETERSEGMKKSVCE